MSVSPLPRIIWEPAVRRDLEIDLGRAGDLTTDAIVPPDLMAVASVVAREPGRIAGLEMATAVFTLLDPACAVRLSAGDGDDVEGGAVLAEVDGPARAILTAERTALNLLGHLSGIATSAAAVVATLDGTGVKVAETRKTTPGLRSLEKYAVRVGGGSNHRHGLDDAVMIKDNHVVVAGGVGPAIEAVIAAVGHTVAIEVEVDTLEQLSEALAYPIDVVLLDNMDPETLAEGVAMVAGRTTVEASGGITPENARAHAESGVDVLSMGWLTHSAPNLDVALDISL